MPRTHPVPEITPGEPPGKLSREGRERFRAELVGEIPTWYSPHAHLIFPSLFGLGLIALSLWSVKDLRAWECLTVPLSFFLANAAEWRAHRDVLHRRQPFARVLYDRHTPMHHRLFVTWDMSLRSTREFRLVLIPAYGIVVIFLVTLPLVWLLSVLVSPNTAALFLTTSMVYMVMYEWLHLSYHMPEESFLGRRRLIRRLKRHHAVHHAPELMQRYNFNVTVPLWDLVRGTVYRGPVPREP